MNVWMDLSLVIVPGLHSNGLVFSFIAVAILVPELIYSFITSPSCLRPELMD